MRLCFNIQLPDQNLQRIGRNLDRLGVVPSGQGFLSGRSMVGFKGRELNRFYPVIMLLESLVQIDQWHLRQEKYAPLYQSGVFYEEEPPGAEEWLDIPTLYKLGKGDCEDIACARVAELREKFGIAAAPCIKFKDFNVRGKRITLIHVLVLLPNGRIEDPSKVLGMKGEYS